VTGPSSTKLSEVTRIAAGAPTFCCEFLVPHCPRIAQKRRLWGRFAIHWMTIPPANKPLGDTGFGLPKIVVLADTGCRLRGSGKAISLKPAHRQFPFK
jgi:hypothetical protein